MTEDHLARLLGEGIHPVTGAKLGKRFPSLQPPRERIAARVARLDPGLRGEARAEAVLERRPVTERRPVLERSSDSALDPDAA